MLKKLQFLYFIWKTDHKKIPKWNIVSVEIEIGTEHGFTCSVCGDYVCFECYVKLFSTENETVFECDFCRQYPFIQEKENKPEPEPEGTYDSEPIRGAWFFYILLSVYQCKEI